MCCVRYDEHPECVFTEGALNFAVHVRMGDRRAFQTAENDYFERLENVMNTISTEVVGRGLPEPMFHVFSEAELPCPSGQPSAFDEFPTWHIGAEEVRVYVSNTYLRIFFFNIILLAFPSDNCIRLPRKRH